MGLTAWSIGLRNLPSNTAPRLLGTGPNEGEVRGVPG
jgi:hypothetical protein